MSFDEIATQIAQELLNYAPEHECTITAKIDEQLSKYGSFKGKDKADLTRGIIKKITQMGYEIASLEPLKFQKFE